MSDIREDILVRLVEVVTEVPGLATVHRNNVDITDDQMPAALVLDGDEEVVSYKPQVMVVEMTPEIQIMEQSETIGSDLTTFRRELIRLVLDDAALLTLTGTNGSIRYTGCVTTIGWQQKQYGVLNMQFTFKYPLQHRDL